MRVIGSIESVWRYPVKGMAGESADEIHLGFAGVYGDRLYSVVSASGGAGFPFFTGRQLGGMLRYQPRFLRPGEAMLPPNLVEAESIAPGATPIHGDAGQLALEVVTPAGRVLRVEDPELLRELSEAAGDEGALSLRRSERPQTDCRPVSLLSLQTVRRIGDSLGSAVDKRRFRANLYVDLHDGEGFAEDAWMGRSARIGEKATVLFLERDPRCKMITLDPDTGASSPEILREVARGNEGKTGVYCAVTVEGTVSPGDDVILL